jgi:outer membrane protein OmpA-like peptidoglycan-associated protein
MASHGPQHPDRAAAPPANRRTQAAVRVPAAKPGDRCEAAARPAAAQAVPGATRCAACAAGAPCTTCARRVAVAPAVARIAAQGLTGASQAMPHHDQIQAPFGRHSIRGIDAHVGGPATRAAAAIGADAYATGSSVAFARAPDLRTAAHEAAHVIQQRAGVHLQDGLGRADDVHERNADEVADRVVRGQSAEPLLDRYRGSGGSGGSGGAPAVQRSISRSEQAGAMGGFEIDLQTRENALTDPTLASGLDGYIRFVPMAGAPNSNTIVFDQIVRLSTAAGADANPSTLPATRAARGALGTPGLRTDDDPGAGVEGGFFTDAHHTSHMHGLQPEHSALSPRYDFQPAAPGTTGLGGTTQQPAIYGGGIGGVFGQTPGFKRSDLPEDMRSAALYDSPAVGGTSPASDLTFTFESAAVGEDTMITYGVVTWGFQTHAGHVLNEHAEVVAGTSATFANAMERHRDFYVHEPVTLYFAFDDATLSGAESAKLATFLPYLARNPNVQMSLEGFADIAGGASPYNVDLSRRRAEAVRREMITVHGIPAARIDTPVVSTGASSAATTDAGTGDQGGSAATGADQTREANRWANRRVVLSFRFIPPAAGTP